MNRNYDVITFFIKYLYFKVTIFAESIKIVTIFIKKIFENSKKFKRITSYVLRGSIYWNFLI